MGGKWVINLKQKCYKTAKNAQKYSYFGQIVDFNDCHQTFLRNVIWPFVLDKFLISLF